MANTPALTTTFIPPTSCLSALFVERTSSVAAIVLGDQRDTASCLPEGLDPMRTSYFSPALYCPVGYTRACSTVVSLGTARETQAKCCPLGGFTCKAADQTFWPFDSSYGCQWFFPTTTVETVTSSSAGAYHTTTRTMRGNVDYLNAFSIQLRWQSTDLAPVTGSSSAEQSSLATAATSSNSSSSTSAPETSIGSGGLSIGAKLGIGLGVGIPVAAIIGVVIVFGLMWVRRKRPLAPATEMDSRRYSYHQQPTIDPYPQHGVPKVAPVEMDTSGRLPELPGTPR